MSFLEVGKVLHQLVNLRSTKTPRVKVAYNYMYSIYPWNQMTLRFDSKRRKQFSMKLFNSQTRIEHPVWKLTQRWGLCLLLFSIVDYPPPLWSNLRTGENFVVSSRHRRLWTWSNFPETPGQIPLAYRKKWWLLFFGVDGWEICRKFPNSTTSSTFTTTPS